MVFFVLAVAVEPFYGALRMCSMCLYYSLADDYSLLRELLSLHLLVLLLPLVFVMFVSVVLCGTSLPKYLICLY